MEYRLDEIDKRIVYHLTNDARNTSAPMIAEEANVSAGTIRNRIAQLEENGVITGYHASVNYERAEGRLTELFVCNVSVADRERLAQQVLDIPGVVNVRELMTGRGNLHVKAVGTDTGDLTRIGRALSNCGIDVVDEHLLDREHSRPYGPFGPEEGTRSAMADLLSLAGGAEVVELTLTEGAPVAGLTLEEAGEEGFIAEDVLVVAIERDETVLTPRGDTRLRPDDLVTVFSPEGTSGETVRAFGGEP